jgi:ketosteroid isomerase-like protein
MRRFILGVTMLAMGSIWAAGAVQALPASAEDEVTAAEQAREEALMKNDFPALDKVLADDMFYCHATGRIDNKAAFVDTLKAGRNRYIKIVRYDTKVRVQGNMGLINTSLDLTVQAQGRDPRIEKVVATIAYEKRGGHWQMISSQSTRKTEATPVPTAK